MKKMIFLLLPLLTLLKTVSAQQLTVDCGDNIAICNGAYEEICIGQNVTIANAVSSTIVKWWCKPFEDWHGNKFYASYFLDDTASLTPYFINMPFDFAESNNTFKFYLQVTDEQGSVAVDSMFVYRSEFIFVDGSMQSLSTENTVYVKGLEAGGNFPMVDYALYNGDTIVLPAYINFEKQDSITLLAIDSVGCSVSKTMPAIYFLSIENETNSSVRMVDGEFLFDNNSIKSIRVFSDMGQLLYSVSTNATRWKIPYLGEAKHCIFEVIVNNERYSFNVILQRKDFYF